MDILKTVLPSGGRFNISDMNNYSLTYPDHQFIGLGFKLKTSNGENRTVNIYINGGKVMINAPIRGSYGTVYMEHPEEIEGNLQSATVAATTGVSQNNVPIDVAEIYIIREFGYPYISGTRSGDKYVNKTSEISFEGNRFTTGIAISFNKTGEYVSLQARPGTLEIIDGKASGLVDIPPGCFSLGENKARRWALNHTKQEQTGTNITFAGVGTVAPTEVSKLKFNNTKPSKDMPATCTWVAEPQQAKYQIKYKGQDVSEIVSEEITSSIPQHTFPAQTLPEGAIEVSVRIYDGFYWSDWESVNVTTYTNRVIVLEPDGVAQAKEKPITVTWESTDPQTAFEFRYTKGGTYQSLISGTTEKSHVFEPDTFGIETVTMQLRIYNGYIWSAWKTVGFITYGKPEAPTITSPGAFDTAYPTFSWESTGQTIYNLKVVEEIEEDKEIIIYDTGDIVSNVLMHTITKALSNNKTYKLKLTIKNQYGYGSDYAFKIFTINYVELQRATFNIFADYSRGAHIIDISNIEDELFKECEIHRKEDGGDWIRIAKELPSVTQYKDLDIKSNMTYSYKIRAISNAGGVTDSETKISYTQLKHAQLLELWNKEITILKVNFKSQITLEQNMVEKFYAGRVTPVASYGEKRYKVISISFAVKSYAEKERFEKLYYSRPILLYREPKGEKIYCYISEKPKIKPSKHYWTIDFTITELFYESEV